MNSQLHRVASLGTKGVLEELVAAKVLENTNNISAEQNLGGAFTEIDVVRDRPLTSNAA